MPARSTIYDTALIDAMLHEALINGELPVGTASRIARLHGCTRQYVSMRIKELGLKSKRGRPRGRGDVDKRFIP